MNAGRGGSNQLHGVIHSTSPPRETHQHAPRRQPPVATFGSSLRDGCGGRYTSGRRTSCGIPVAAATAKTRLIGTLVHKETAWLETPRARASACLLPISAMASFSG